MAEKTSHACLREIIGDRRTFVCATIARGNGWLNSGSRCPNQTWKPDIQLLVESPIFQAQRIPHDRVKWGKGEGKLQPYQPTGVRYVSS